MTKELQIGKEYWTWVKSHDSHDIPFVRKIVIKDIFTVMVTADVSGTGWSIDVPKEELYNTQEDAIEALQKELDKND